MTTMEAGWWDAAPIVDVRPNKRVLIRRLARFIGVTFGVARIWWPVLPVAVLLAVYGPLVAGWRSWSWWSPCGVAVAAGLPAGGADAVGGAGVPVAVAVDRLPRRADHGRSRCAPVT